MKTVSMGTSAREGARGRASGGSHSRMSYNFCYKRRTSLSLSETGWDGASLPHTHTRRRTWRSGPPRIVWGRDGRRRQVYVCTHCRRACLGGVAEEEHLTRHCQGTHE